MRYQTNGMNVLSPRAARDIVFEITKLEIDWTSSTELSCTFEVALVPQPKSIQQHRAGSRFVLWFAEAYTIQFMYLILSVITANSSTFQKLSRAYLYELTEFEDYVWFYPEQHRHSQELYLWGLVKRRRRRGGGMHCFTIQLGGHGPYNSLPGYVYAQQLLP